MSGRQRVSLEEMFPGIIADDVAVGADPESLLRIKMDAETETWLAKHRSHIGQVISVKIAGGKLLRHMRCGECGDEFKFEASA